MGRRRRSTIVTIAGLSFVSGSASSRRWRPLAPFPTSFPSTAATSKRIARRAAQKGEFEEAIGRSRGGRTSKSHALADDRGRPAAFALTQRKRRRRRHGRSASRRRGETKAAAGGQGLRRRQA